MNIEYSVYSEENRVDFFFLVHQLYIEDPQGETMKDEKIMSTIDFLTINPQHGQILIIKENKEIIGYSILIYYWSNEFGGQIIFIDELFLKTDHRNKNIGTIFLNYLITKGTENFKAIFLEVFPSNKRAYEFYTRNGFIKNEGNFLKCIL